MPKNQLEMEGSGKIALGSLGGIVAIIGEMWCKKPCWIIWDGNNQEKQYQDSLGDEVWAESEVEQSLW